MNDSQEIRMPPSRAIHSSCRSVLLASRFIQITLTTNSVITVAGMLRSKISVFSFSFLINEKILSIDEASSLSNTADAAIRTADRIIITKNAPHCKRITGICENFADFFRNPSKVSVKKEKKKSKNLSKRA